MESSRLRLSYSAPLPSQQAQLCWRQGLGHWLHSWHKPWQLPLRAWSLPLLLLLPVLMLLGWVHESGQERYAVYSSERPAEAELPAVSAPVVQVVEQTPVIDWAPNEQRCEYQPSDHLPVPDDARVRLKVVTIKARVTAYTPYDHAESYPSWADGIVAWHPDGRRRHVNKHRYCLATDWSQFPPGATFIHVPGYMSKTFPDFPECFRVVDDGCGQARKATRRGLQPVIDVRYMTRHSAIDGRSAWGSKNLEVEVVFPEDFAIPSSLKPWVVKQEVRVYDANGVRLR